MSPAFLSLLSSVSLLFSHCLLVPFNCISLSSLHFNDPLILVWAGILDEFYIINVVESVTNHTKKIHTVGSSVFVPSFSLVAGIPFHICWFGVCAILQPREVWPPLILWLRNESAAVATFWSVLCLHCSDDLCLIASPGIWLNENSFWVSITLRK